VVADHDTNFYLNPLGTPTVNSQACGGVSHWVHKIDWTTGNPLWSGVSGSSTRTAAIQAQGAGWGFHPGLELFCGFLASDNQFSPDCDLDYTLGVNTGDTATAPGSSSYFWSLFLVCQNVSSNAPVPPYWTHTISSTGTDNSNTLVADLKNAWAGNDILVQAVSRIQFNSAFNFDQGLQWPFVGTSVRKH